MEMMEASSSRKRKRKRKRKGKRQRMEMEASSRQRMEMEASSRKRKKGKGADESSRKGKRQTLYICFSATPKGYAIHSISEFKRSRHHQKAPPLNELWSYSDDDAYGTGVGCVILDSKLYFVGSDLDDNESVVSYNLADGSVTFYPNMLFSKVNPFVFSANNRIYVLAEPKYYYPDDSDDFDELFVRPDPDPSFEVFHLSTQKWEILTPPPFADPQSDYYHTCQGIRGCALIGGYICVSTSESSFKFKIDVDDDDVKKMIWEPCMLFDDLPSPDSSRRPWTLLGSYNRFITRDSPPCGPPFPFDGRAILFGDDDDILISMDLDKLVAYEMVGDRVVKSQSFTIPGITMTSCISDIGDGLLSIVSSSSSYIDYRNNSFYVKLLRLNKKKEDGDGEEFLQCELVNEFRYHFENSQIWSSGHGRGANATTSSKKAEDDSRSPYRWEVRSA